MGDYLARTTVDPKEWSALSEARAWVWICRLQIDRIGRDFGEEFGKAWSQGPPISPDTAIALRLLRNLYEHVDDPHLGEHFVPEIRSQDGFCPPKRHCSARTFQDKWPHAFPWKIAWKTKDELYLGDVLRLRTLVDELDGVEKWLAERG